VPWDEIVKGYELDDGRWVTMTDEDFEAANVKATRTIDVLGAVCLDEITTGFYDQPYYLAPEQAGMKAYALLREALKQAGRVAVAQIVIRSRQRLCAIVPQNDVLVCEVLRYPYELRAVKDLELPGEDLEALGVTQAEQNLAKQLVATIETDWDPSRYQDTYHDDLLKLIQKKAAGETIEVPEAPQPAAEVVDIMSLLKKSVEDARKAKGEEREPAGAGQRRRA
jgi:DNA end-binding protein Ku